MDRRTPWVLIGTWLLVGAAGTVALPAAWADGADALRWTLGVEAVVGWALVWVAMLIPRISTLTVARIGVPAALVAAVVTLVVGEVTVGAAGFLLASLVAMAALANPLTIDSFVDGSSYGPEQRFALRTPPLTGLVAVPLTWAVAAFIAVVPPLAVSGHLFPALVLGVVWVGGVRWAVRSLHLPSRRWVVFVPAGMVVSDPYVLTDRVLFPRRNVEAVGPAYAATDATDFSQGALGLALQLDLSEPFALPVIDRTSTEGPDAGERTVTTDRIVFSVLRPGALLDAARERRFKVGETRPAEPQCLHHAADGDDVVDALVEESQTAVPLPRTRSSR